MCGRRPPQDFCVPSQVSALPNTTFERSLRRKWQNRHTHKLTLAKVFLRKIITKTTDQTMESSASTGKFLSTHLISRKYITPQSQKHTFWFWKHPTDALSSTTEHDSQSTYWPAGAQIATFPCPSTTHNASRSSRSMSFTFYPPQTFTPDV